MALQRVLARWRLPPVGADTIVVEVHDPGGGLAGTVARIPNEVRGYVRGYARSHLWPLFQASAYVDALGTTVALANGRDPEVRILDDRFNLRLILRWEDSDREVTRSDIRVWREDYVESRTGPGASELPGARQDADTSRRPTT